MRIIDKCLNRPINDYHTKVALALTHPPVTSAVRPASNNWQLGASPPDCRRLDFIIIYSTSTDWTENIRILFTSTFVVLLVIIVIVRLLHIGVYGKYSMIHIKHRKNCECCLGHSSVSVSVSQKSLKSLSKVSQKSLKSLSKVPQKSLKSLSKVPQKSLKSLSKSKPHSLTDWLSEWQGHLLSCPGQLNKKNTGSQQKSEY